MMAQVPVPATQWETKIEFQTPGLDPWLGVVVDIKGVNLQMGAFSAC